MKGNKVYPGDTLTILYIFLVFPSFMFSALLARGQVVDSQNNGQIIAGIDIAGNSKTKPYIIYRELLFKTGDTLAPSILPTLLEKSEKNLLNTSLFNFATIKSHEGVDGIYISITVVERWYIWPSPIVEITDRNFNSWWASRDFTRVNYGFRLKWSNFRGRMENLDLFLRSGKNHQYSLIYEVPYIEKKKKLGAGVEIGIVSKREVGYKTTEDKLLYLFNSEYLLHQKYATVRLSYRRNIHTSHLLETGFQHLEFSDTLLKYNPEYSYFNHRVSRFINLYYKLKIDYRDAKYYPLSGWYVDAEISKAGMGFEFEKPVDMLWIQSTSRIYVPLSSRWFCGSSIVWKISSRATQPYYYMRGLGFNRDFVRGYEYYVVDGKHFILWRNTIKVALLPPREKNLAFIPTQKFSRIHYASYLTFFTDAGYVWQQTESGVGLNVLPGTLLIGTGLGMDIVTYYDKVVRIEYSVNKLGESGIFIHFIAGI